MREVFLNGFSYHWGDANFNNNEKTYPMCHIDREEKGDGHTGTASLEMPAFLHTAGGSEYWCTL